MVECNLAKVEAVGSNPIGRSRGLKMLRKLLRKKDLLFFYWMMSIIPTFILLGSSGIFVTAALGVILIALTVLYN